MRTRTLVFFVIIFLLFLSGGKQSAAAETLRQGSDFAQIDAYVQAEMERASIPGLVYGVVSGNQIVHLNAYGVADPSGRAVTPQTPFVIGSVGKTFTALAITQLEAAGRLDIDAPVRRYIPWFRTADSKSGTSDPAGTITLRHLRSHTSGFSHADGNKAFFFAEHATLEELVRAMESVHLNRPVGSEEEYSNLNFLVLGLVIQKVSGQSFEAYVQEHILVPLNMRHTCFSLEAAMKDGLASGYHIWYGIPIPMRAPFPAGAAAQGFVISTAEDMAHYLIAYLNNGAYHDISVTGQSAQVKPIHSRFWYDIYWQARNDKGNVASGQSGGTQNYNAFIQEAFSIQGQNYGVVVLLNTRPDYLVQIVSAQTIGEGIVALLYGNQVSQPSGLARDTWYITNLFIDLILVGLIVYTVFSILSFLHQPKCISMAVEMVTRARVSAGLAIFTGLIIFSLPPILTGIAWPDLFLAYIEICIIVLPCSLILMGTGLARLGILGWNGLRARARYE